ncbi:hypothetical protein [Microbulbifer rhizosphaerae]|uniref:hypothetical protein n=1 Tax=Microbulbifer rhizosphaerae TaxID=1562603 RepID=UPI001C85514F|nr:hypothetical protein [Microbulbifer rhizosphaerae]
MNGVHQRLVRANRRQLALLEIDTEVLDCYRDKLFSRCPVDAYLERMECYFKLLELKIGKGASP